MDGTELNEIKELNDDDLIALYDRVIEHLEYLKQSLITYTEDGGESNG